MNLCKMTPEEKIAYLKSYETAMYRVAKGILIQEEDAQDAMQEAAIRAYQNMDKVKEKQYLKTWVLRITINEANRIYKKRKQHSLISWSGLDQVIHRNLEENWDLHHAISRLEKKYKEPLVLYYFADCSYEETAQALNLPVGTIKSRIYYGKDKLRERLGAEYE